MDPMHVANKINTIVSTNTIASNWGLWRVEYYYNTSWSQNVFTSFAYFFKKSGQEISRKI